MSDRWKPKEVLHLLQRLWTVRTKMTLLAFTTVLVALGVGGTVLLLGFRNMVERDLGRRAISIGRTVAQMGVVQENVGRPGGAALIQPVAERVRLVNHVDYVVVLDMNRVRHSHPLSQRIGTRFESGDEGPALSEQTYYSRAQGIDGPSVRAFVPIMDHQGIQQVGVVVVGSLTPTFSRMWRDVADDLTLAAALAAAVGLLMAWWLASTIKQQMLGLEPQELARILEERSAILDTIGEGLIAIDAGERITVINHEARRLLGVDEGAVGRPIREVIPNTRLPEVLRQGKPTYDQEMLLGSTLVLTSRVPIRARNRIAGAVATFRDKSDVGRLAEELTGVKRFAESLRAQKHEFMNKLHTIAGLIHLKEYRKALDYIVTITTVHQELTAFLTRSICDFRIAALLIGKHSRAGELGIDLAIDPRSRLFTLPRRADANVLVLIIGNLLENAMEAAAERPSGQRKVRCLIDQDEQSLTIQVSDNGPGIPPLIQPHIFEAGFTTKDRPGGGGVGLALVRMHLTHAGGEIHCKTSPEGTIFTVQIPVHDPTAVTAAITGGGPNR